MAELVGMVSGFGETRETKIWLTFDPTTGFTPSVFLAKTYHGEKLYPVSLPVKLQADGTWKVSSTRVTVLRRPAQAVCWMGDTRVRETSLTIRNGWQS